MGFSDEINGEINQFAKEQSKLYLEDAEMTYAEKLQRRTGQTKRKIARKLAKFKIRSDTALEAQNDLVLYMSDYIKDLMTKGISEKEAFERAKQQLEFRSDTGHSATLKEQFGEYYQTSDPANYEAIGLFYGAFLFLGFTGGAITGFVTSGGRGAFLTGGWIDTLIGVAVGVLIGLGMGLLTNAIFVLRRK